MVTVRTLFTAAAFLLLALLLPNGALAQDAKEATALHLSAPDHAYLGEQVTVQAVLTDSAGKPIPLATIYFLTPATFLGGSGDMLLAQAVTNKNGQAVADVENSIAGALDLRAEFRGDNRHAPSDAAAQITITGDQQVYVEHAGVQIPTLNEPPPAPVAASLSRPLGAVTPDVQALWPSLSGWPVALVLLIVWSLYLFVVVLIFRIAAASPQKRAGYNVETGRFE